MAVHLPRKTVAIGAVKLSLQDVATIYDRLAIQVSEQADREIASLIKGAEQSDEQFEQYKTNARERAFRITVTLAGRDGQSLYGDDNTIFYSPNKPEKVDSIYITNITAYRGFVSTNPMNMFELNLDFSKPPLLDASNPVSAPTRNVSNLVVQGDRESWVSTVSDAVTVILQGRKTRRTWLHRAFAYDFGMMAFALPFSFYVCWKVAPLISKYIGNIHDVLAGAAYVYVFFLMLNIYRILFGYAKWAFPSVELSDNRDASGQHRAVLGVIVLGLIVDVIWQIVHG